MDVLRICVAKPSIEYGVRSTDNPLHRNTLKLPLGNHIVLYSVLRTEDCTEEIDHCFKTQTNRPVRGTLVLGNLGTKQSTPKVSTK